MDAGTLVFLLFIVGGLAYAVYQTISYRQEKRRLLVVLRRECTTRELCRDYGFGYDVYSMLSDLEEDGEITSRWDTGRGTVYRRGP